MAGVRHEFLDTSDDESLSPLEQEREQEPFDVEVIPSIFINPIDMSPEAALLLTQFLRSAIAGLGEVFVSQNVNYKVTYEDASKNSESEGMLAFQYDMVWYLDGEHPEQDQFAVIGDTLIGEGSFCQVRKVKGMLKTSPTGALFYQSHKNEPKDNRLVARIDFHKEGWAVENARHIFELTKFNKRLGLRYPMWTKRLGDPELGASIGIMRQLKSHDLDQILAIEDRHPGYLKAFLQTHQRWDLFEIFDFIIREALSFSDLEALQWSLAIIQAYKQQVLAHHIVHCDIKPENIMMDLSKGPCVAAVTFIDFGDAKKIGAPLDKLVGTKGYIAPEVYELTGSVSSQIDTYALACVLAQWFGDASVYVGSSSQDGLDIFQSSDKEFDFADNAPLEIKHILERMVAINPSERPKIEEVEQVYEAEIIFYELEEIARLTPAR